jgi:hypothetical protein
MSAAAALVAASARARTTIGFMGDVPEWPTVLRGEAVARIANLE